MMRFNSISVNDPFIFTDNICTFDICALLVSCERFILLDPMLRLINIMHQALASTPSLSLCMVAFIPAVASAAVLMPTTPLYSDVPLSSPTRTPSTPSVSASANPPSIACSATLRPIHRTHTRHVKAKDNPSRLRTRFVLSVSIERCEGGKLPFRYDRLCRAW